MQTDTSVVLLNTSLIVPNKYQPRKVFPEKELKNLAESIKTYGIINPILVRKKEDKYEIIAGERRFRAAKSVGLTEVPVIIKNADEQQMAELALIENIQRQELSPIEEAKSYEEIMRLGNQTQQSLSQKLGKSQASIANKIRLLSLPKEIQDALANKQISERHARTLLSVQDEDKQLELLNKIITERLTVKETEQLINKNKNLVSTINEEQDIKKDLTEDQINEEEIKQAISDIMKSLNIKEEEKEDDNMNNGNFFPNFDNNNVANNNATLNTMNMQSMNQAPMEPVPEVVMPTQPQDQMMNQTSQVNLDQNQMANMQQPMYEPIMPQVDATIQPQMNNNYNQPQIMPMEQPVASPMVDEPLFNPNVVMPTQPQEQMMNQAPQVNLDQNQMVNMQPMNDMSVQPNQNLTQPMINDEPLFGPFIAPQPQEQPVAPPMVDEPLFNPNATMPNMNQPQVNQDMNQQPAFTPEQQPINNQNSFVVPVTEESPVEPDKLTNLQDLLNANDYQYKTYQNDTTTCIIIELPRN